MKSQDCDLTTRVMWKSTGVNSIKSEAQMIPTTLPAIITVSRMNDQHYLTQFASVALFSIGMANTEGELL